MPRGLSHSSRHSHQEDKSNRLARVFTGIFAPLYPGSRPGTLTALEDRLEDGRHRTNSESHSLAPGTPQPRPHTWVAPSTPPSLLAPGSNAGTPPPTPGYPHAPPPTPSTPLHPHVSHSAHSSHSDKHTPSRIHPDGQEHSPPAYAPALPPRSSSKSALQNQEKEMAVVNPSPVSIGAASHVRTPSGGLDSIDEDGMSMQAALGLVPCPQTAQSINADSAHPTPAVAFPVAHPVLPPGAAPASPKALNPSAAEAPPCHGVSAPGVAVYETVHKIVPVSAAGSGATTPNERELPPGAVPPALSSAIPSTATTVPNPTAEATPAQASEPTLDPATAPPHVPAAPSSARTSAAPSVRIEADRPPVLDLVVSLDDFEFDLSSLGLEESKAK